MKNTSQLSNSSKESRKETRKKNLRLNNYGQREKVYEVESPKIYANFQQRH